jgi:hypothetical protein
MHPQKKSAIQNLGSNNLATDETQIFTDKRKNIQDTG